MQDLSSALTLSNLRGGHTITDRDRLSIEVLQTDGDIVLHGHLDLLLDEAGGERADKLVENIVLRVTDGELESVNLDIDVLDLEDGGLVFVGGDEVYGSLILSLVQLP